MTENFVPKWFRGGKSASPNDPHQQAEDLMFEADAAGRAGNEELVKELSLRAARLEEEALRQIPLNLPRTRAIIGDSAVSLYLHAESLNDVRRLGEELIKEKDPVLLAFSRNDILKMLEIANSPQQPQAQ